MLSTGLNIYIIHSKHPVAISSAFCVHPSMPNSLCTLSSASLLIETKVDNNYNKPTGGAGASVQLLHCCYCVFRCGR